MTEEKEQAIEPSIVKMEEQPVLRSQTSYFENGQSFDHVQRVATVFSKSDMVPKRYQGNMANCIIALEMAGRMNASPLMVMQNLDIIQGKPGWSSKFLIASLNSCGKFSPLRYEEDNENGGRTRAWAYEKAANEKIYGIWVSLEMAKAEGWTDKNGSKWKTMPDLMRRYRAASFFVNQFAPELSMGLPTIEEIYDISSNRSEIDYDDLCLLFDLKKDSLTEQEITDGERILKGKEILSYKKLQTLLQSK